MCHHMQFGCNFWPWDGPSTATHKAAHGSATCFSCVAGAPHACQGKLFVIHLLFRRQKKLDLFYSVHSCGQWVVTQLFVQILCHRQRNGLLGPKHRKEMPLESALHCKVVAPLRQFALRQCMFVGFQALHTQNHVCCITCSKQFFSGGHCSCYQLHLHQTKWQQALVCVFWLNG